MTGSRGEEAASRHEGGEPEEGTSPEPAAARPVRRARANRPVARPSKPADGTQLKSRFALVVWDTTCKPGNRGWVGRLAATNKHPYLKTPRYHTDEEAARAVDR